MPKAMICDHKRFLHTLTTVSDLETLKSLCHAEIEYIYRQCGVEFDKDENFLGDAKVAEKCKNQFTKYVREIKHNFPIDKIPPHMVRSDSRHGKVHMAIKLMKMHPSIIGVYNSGKVAHIANKQLSLFTMDIDKLFQRTHYYLAESSNPSHWLLGLAIATGRRFNEIFLISEFDDGDASPFQLGDEACDEKWGEFVLSNPSVDCLGFEKLSPSDFQIEVKLPVFTDPDLIMNCHGRLKDYVSQLNIKNENTSYHQGKISGYARKELLGEVLQWQSKEEFSTHKLRSVYACLVSELHNMWWQNNGALSMDISLVRRYALRDRSRAASDHYIAWELSVTDKEKLWKYFNQL